MNSLTIDLEDLFNLIENMLMSSMNIEIPTGLYFNNRRYPINYNGIMYYSGNGKIIDVTKELEYESSYGSICDDKGNILANKNILINKLVNTIPFLAIHSAELFINVIDIYQRSINPYSDLYFKDSLGIYDIKLLSIPERVNYVEDILNRDIYRTVNINTKKEICIIIENFINKHILDFMSINPTSLYELDVSNRNCILHNKGDIRAIRYELSTEYVNGKYIEPTQEEYIKHMLENKEI